MGAADLLSTVWVFVNNDERPPQRTLTGYSRIYCTLHRSPPLAPIGYEWYDALTGASAVFDKGTGCYAASDSDPKVLVMRQKPSGKGLKRS